MIKMDMDSGESSSMAMYFNTDLPVTVAFEGWKIENTGTLIGSCFGVAGIAIVYEIMKILRQYFWQVYSRQSPYLPKENQVSPSDAGVKSPSTKLNDKPRYGYFWGMHILSSLIFPIQVLIGYLLMLIVMVYNVWLVVSVVVGLCLGYFIAYFIGAALGYDEIQTNQDRMKTSIETIDMVIPNHGAVQPPIEGDNDSEYGF